MSGPSAPPSEPPSASRGPGWLGLAGACFLMTVIAAVLLAAAKLGGWWWLGPGLLLVVFFFWYLGLRRKFYNDMEQVLQELLADAQAREQTHHWFAALDRYLNAGQLAIRLRHVAGEQAAVAGRDRCRNAARQALERMAFVLYGLHAGREKALTNLRNEPTANLTGVNAKDEDLEALPGLPHLTRLHLRGKFITDKTLAVAGQAHGLIELYLENTAVTDAGLAAYREAAWRPDSPEAIAARETGENILQSMVWAADDPAAAPPAGPVASEINDLKFVHIEGSPITDAGLAHLAGFTALERLSLHKTKITGVGLGALGALPLKSLSLDGAAIDDAGMEEISLLHGTLERLELFDTTVTDAGLEPLGELDNLERLNLLNAPVTDAGLKHLAGLKKLQFLALRGTKVTDAGVKTLQAALPECQISR